MKTPVCYFFFFFLVANLHSQVNTERFRISTDSLGFSCRAGLDMILMKGNTDFIFLGTNSRLNYNWGEDYIFLVFNGGFGENNEKSFFSQALMHLRNVTSINDFLQVEEFIQYNNDKQLLLLNRTLAGVGFRYKLISNKETVLRFGTSAFFEHESYDLPFSSFHSNYVNTFRFNTYLTLLIETRSEFSILSTTYFQPAILDFKDIRILSDNALSIKLGKYVDFVVSLNLHFDSQPISDIKKLDLVTKIGAAINL